MFAGSTVSHIFNKVRKAAGIKKGKLHDMRKTFASMLSDFGISESFVQLWLGHSSPDITRKHYISFTDEMTIRKMKEFEKSMNFLSLSSGKNVGKT
jgi:integrase